MKEETDEGEEKGVARRRRDDDDDGDADEHDDDERDDGNSTLVEGEVIEVRCDGDGHPAPAEAGFFLAPSAERNGRPIYASGPRSVLRDLLGHRRRCRRRRAAAASAAEAAEDVLRVRDLLDLH